jgi:ribonuclease R
MADDYYRFVERAHVLRGEKNGRVYRLGDRVRVQVIRVDLERRQVDLGIADILSTVRTTGRGRAPRREAGREPKAKSPRQERPRAGRQRRSRAGRRERQRRGR